MGAVRVLDRELVEAEPLLHLAQQLLVRLVQADPDEPPLAGPYIELVDIQIGDPAAILIGCATDHHVRS